MGGNKSIQKAKSIANDIEKFLSNCAHSSTSKTSADLLLNRQVLQDHYDKLNNDYQPTTVAEKLRQIRIAINFLIHHNHENNDMYIKGRQIITTLDRWIKRLSKSIGKQCQQHGMTIRDTLANESPTKTASEFLKSTRLLAKVDSAILNLGSSFDPKDVKILTAYAACQLLYGNSQRSGVVENLAVNEFSQRQRKLHDNEERIIIPCLNHKTGPQGIAQLVVTVKGEELLLQYHTLVRAKITPKPGCEQYFFLTYSGVKYTQVFRKIIKSIKINNIDIKEPPKPELFRIGMSSKVSRHLSDAKRRTVVRHMSHSDQTSQKCYEFINLDDAAKAFDEINKLM